MIRHLAIAVLILSVSVYLVLKEVERRWREPLLIDAGGYYLKLEPGQRFRSVVEKLQQEEVIGEPYILLAYGRFTGQDEQIKRGEYLIPEGTTAAGLLEILGEGAVIQYQVTLPEGITVQQAIVLLGETFLAFWDQFSWMIVAVVVGATVTFVMVSRRNRKRVIEMD